METSSKRGKIPQKDWPLIIKRYEAGETLSAIARTYDCSPPAISYILSRSRVRDSVANSVAPDAAEPWQPGLVKTPPAGLFPSTTQGPSADGRIDSHRIEAQTSLPIGELDPDPPETESTGASNDQRKARDEWTDVAATGLNASLRRHGEIGVPLDPPGNGNPGSSDPGVPSALPQHDESRGTLHLPLSQRGSHHSDPQALEARGSTASEGADIRPASGQQQRSFAAPGRDYATTNYSRTVHTAGEADRTTVSAAFIDRVLRQRVGEDIAVFLAAFDAALADDSPETRAALRQATDRLLRAGARTRIELERLEARVPLPARENIGHSGPTWRLR